MRWRKGIRLLRRRGWLLLLQALLTAAAAYAFSAMQAPTYEATAAVYISSRSPDVQTQDMAEVRRTYAAQLDSSYVAARVIARLGLDRQPPQLLEDVTVTADADAPTVAVAVESTHPTLAAEIARAWAEELVAMRRDANVDALAEERIEAELLDDPQVELLGPRTALNTIAGLLFGLLLGGALILALESLAAAVIRDEDDLAQVVDAPVLGAIPSARRPR